MAKNVTLTLNVREARATDTDNYDVPSMFEVYCLGSHWGTFFVDDKADREKLNEYAKDKTATYRIRSIT